MTISHSDDFLIRAKDAAARGDIKSATSILLAAIEKEEADGATAAAFSLGLIYNMDGEFHDKDAALKYYELAERGGAQDATYRIAGILYRKGDESAALSKYMEIADYDPSAAYWCSRILYNRSGNETEVSRRYLEKAASMGHVFARRKLILSRMKGKEGFSNIPSAIADFFRLIVEARSIASSGDKRLLE